MNTLLLLISGLLCLHTFLLDGITQIQNCRTQIDGLVDSIFHCWPLTDDAKEISNGILDAYKNGMRHEKHTVHNLV